MLPDHLNSTSMVVSASGVPEDESDYSPFGTEYIVTGPGANHYKFTGKERDSESGLYYFGARYYSNGLGRFITPDWAAKATAVPYADFPDPQSLNLYTYVRNIPTTRYDADGHVGNDDLDKARQGDPEATERLQKQYEQKISDFLEKLDNFTSFNGWKTDKQVAADASAQDAKDRADWANKYPYLPYPEKKIGIVVPAGGMGTTAETGETLSRLGTSKESAARLGRKAAEAEEKIGIHGVSTTAATPTGPASSASRTAVEGQFTVHDTPTSNDPFHRTIELPKPVTQAIADMFNKIFGR